MLSSPGLEREVAESTRQISLAAERAANLTRQLLMFSRKQIMQPQLLDLNEVISNLANMLRTLVGEQVSIKMQTQDPLASINADPGMMEQILVNLTVNARDAMPRGGTLLISTTTHEIDEAAAQRQPEAKPGPYLCLSVADTGYGMDEATLDRIFEPFFTTKPTGEGTGLGLALVHAITKEHAGSIDFNTEIGRGTTFIVHLPMMRDPEVAEDGMASLPRGQGEVVLCVDDERDVLGALEEMVALLGYEPVGFHDPRDALEVLRANPSHFALIVSDEVMPGMAGTQLAAEAHRLRPSLPVIIASGYGGVGFETRLAAAGVGQVLRKPYQVRNLAEAIASALRHA